ncbi:protein-export chaperone SecB [Candidatus Liberibacter africanus]|uniref:Protein-export protein SecB n=1 Tax=Candidatus Liberibacter africanus PTSAPSY TaxID=1277257 RepID=A0A0G3I4I7_LIBAF|nr:protein-export chaperone SecB [Candidatus Liberibacter africanus]AKK20155.1 preprotein translocase subunit SecB [Candidatus Liberibacter africanus PTSAPSY]QTP63955.1 protein-export chaperone SecB [Candidatus Liberibacter africanus]
MEQQRQFTLLNQYIKDLSFESPNAPYCFSDIQKKQPTIQINVQVNASSMSETDFDVVLSFDIEAKNDEKIIFHLEIAYSGIIRIIDCPKESIPHVLFVECSQLLFPFVRQIISNTIRDGGFPPFIIDTIDFLKLFQQKKSSIKNHE